MTLLGKTYIRRNGRRCTWPGLGVSGVVLAALIILIWKTCAVQELSPIIYGLESDSLRHMPHVTFSPLKLVSYVLRTNLMTSSSVISFSMMITLTSYVVLLLWRRIRNYYATTRVSQRRRFGSGYWSRRRIYWRQRDISRSGYIVEALQGTIKVRIHRQSESQERKEEMLTKTYPDVVKRNGYAVSGGLSEDDVKDLNEVMLYKKKNRCSKGKGKSSFKKRGCTSKKMLPFIVNPRRKPVKKQNGFRRRTGRPSKSCTVEGQDVGKRVSMAKSLSRRKKKKKRKNCTVMEQAASQKPSKPSMTNRVAPRYHLTLNQVMEAYKTYRKGRGFQASKKVLWKNRHRLVFGSRNFYKFGRYESYRMREKEYDVPEPPDQDEDPQLLETGPSYISDEASDGPFRREITKIKPTDLNTLSRTKQTERDMELSKQSNSQMRNGEKRSERVQKYAPLGSVLSTSDQRTDPTIILGMGPEFSSDPAGDGPVYNSNTRRRGEERCERTQEYTPSASILSSWEQRTDPANIVLGMGPEFSSDPAGDGPVYNSDTESSDGSESSYDPVEDKKRMKKKLNAKSNRRRKKGDERSKREKVVKKQSNARWNPVNNCRRKTGEERCEREKELKKQSNARWNPRRKTGEERSEREKELKKQSNAQSNTRRKTGEERSEREKELKKQSNARWNPSRKTGEERSEREKELKKQSNARSNPVRKTGEERSEREKELKKQSNARSNPVRKTGEERSEREKELKKRSHREKNPLPDEYDLNSPHPPTKLQCKGSGQYVSNAVAAFYASQPPSPEQTKPYFESILSRPLFIKLFRLAVGKFNPDLSEEETDFIGITNILNSAARLNKYRDILGDMGEVDIEDPAFHENLRECTQDLVPRELDIVLDKIIKELLKFADEYRSTYRDDSVSSHRERTSLVKKMESAIKMVDLSLDIDAEEFYRMYREYTSLKDRSCKTCTVCGSRRPVDKLDDAVDFFETLEVSDDQAVVFNGMLYNAAGVEDEDGKLAQRCFHIEQVNERLYHFLDFDEEEYQKVREEYDGENPTQDARFSLVQSGKLKKLPACQKCFNALKRRYEWRCDTGNEYESENCPPLPKFCFKRRDFGRIPAGMPKLSKLGRTAISPFVAYTRILQLRNPVKDAECGQSATTGTNFSLSTTALRGKEFFIPQTDGEFCGSYNTTLPRDDITHRHRLFFMGNEKQWRLMERRLNKMNVGLDFDVHNCMQWLKVLKRTEAFGCDIELRRLDELDRLASQVREKVSSLSTTDSVDGIVLEDNELVSRLANMHGDDVARARSVLNSKGVKTDVPGITCSLFNNPDQYGGKLPVLQGMLKSINNNHKAKTDRLLLGLEKVLPDEFSNFPKVTALSFPDKFPIPVTSDTFMGTSMMNVSVRQHLLDHYDGRFCDPDIIFWWYSVLSRHCTIRNTASFFKKNTNARRKFEELCNEEGLEERLKAAVKDNSTSDAKKLNKEFTNLINVVGGYTPWSTTERQKTLGRLYAMANFFGPPSFFFTLAPCIADSEIAIQFLNLPTVKYKLKESTHAERSTWTAQNPVASCKAYHTIVKALVSTFIKIRTGNTKSTDPIDCLDNAVDGRNYSSLDSVHSSSEQWTVPTINLSEDVSLSSMFERQLNSRMGCLGTPTAFYGVHEAQGRGALHMHALVWGLLNSELMERCTQKELKQICRIIDKRIATCISEQDVQVEVSAKEDDTFVRCARRVIQEGLSFEELWSLGLRVMYTVQNHVKCTFTCFKNKGFWASCRMAKPSALSLITKIYHLIPVKNMLGEHELPIRSEKIPDPPEEDLFPSKVTNILWCDHKRISEVDANLVEGNPLISAAFGWNTCINFMATPGSCQSALYYVANYMRKPIGLLSGILPLVLSSTKKRIRYPSRADDAGDPTREAKYLSSIILNKLNASQEVSDQIAASAVYGYDSYISSHNFAKLYVVDLFKFLKNKGKSLPDNSTELDDDDKEDVIASAADVEEEPDISPVDVSGLGQSCYPIKRKLTAEEGGRIIIDMVRDIDDYVYRGPEFAALSPYTYKAVVTKVRRSEIDKRSSRKFKAGHRPHLVVEFQKNHPQYDTHVQRLRSKFSIIQFIGMNIPKNPGPRPACESELPAWERKMTKLCNFIEAVYLPWENVERGFRPYQEVLAELRAFKFGNGDGHSCGKNSFVNKHIIRTIGFALNNKGISYDEKKMIQLVRHQFSRKRGALSDFLDDKAIHQHVDEMELLEVVRDHQLELLGIKKGKSAMDLHVEELIAQYRSLTTGVNTPCVAHLQSAKVEMSMDDARALLNEVEKRAEENSKNEGEFVDMNAGVEGSESDCSINRELFFKGIKWTNDQKRAAEYMLDKLDKRKHNEQLLMLLHGPPGTGKTFLIERLQKMTNIKMRITATSGVAAMSLNGITIDSFLGKGRGKKKSTLETVRTNLGDATLVVIDEMSMLGCRKLVELDSILQKVKKSTAPFGGVDLIAVGDYAQLPAVKQKSVIEAMVSSTSLHTPSTELTLKTVALFSRFVKYDLEVFNRSKGCPLLISLLKQFRNCLSGLGSFTLEDIKRIGILDIKALAKDFKLGDSTFLVATRREKDAIISCAGKMWAEEMGRPLFWWYLRPASFDVCGEDADVYAEAMHSKCSGAKGYYVEGCDSTLKRNIAPSSGFANGTKGTVVGLVHKDGYVLPKGDPGEVIKIEPPEYVIMKVVAKDGTSSLVPCKLKVSEIDYRFEGKERKYRCMSNEVSLSFAQTVHEVQGQTLGRVILVLGRSAGRSIGRVTWSLLYVALSRVKKLDHVKFFPCGRSNSIDCFKHLTKLKPPSNFVRWRKGYHKHVWNPNLLQQKQASIEKVIESKLRALGRERTLILKNDILRGYLKGLCYRKLYELDRRGLQLKIYSHMVRKKVWQKTDEDIFPRTKRRSSRRLGRLVSKQKQAKKRKFSNVISESLSDGKRKVSIVDFSAPKQKRVKMVIPDVSPKNQRQDFVRCKGLENLGNTCYFNSVVQTLLHCPLVKQAIMTAPQSIHVIRELRNLFVRMMNNDASTYISPSECYNALTNSSQWREAQMSLDNRQEDAHEMFIKLLEHLDEELTRIAEVFNIPNVFNIAIRSTLTCQRCFYNSDKTEYLWLLSLHFPWGFAGEASNSQELHIYSLIDRYLKLERLPFHPCSQCGFVGGTVKKLDIVNSPQVLVIHISRFNSGLQKIDAFVKFPTELNTGHIRSGDGNLLSFKLMGIIAHEGSSIAAGHFLAYILIEGIWYEADDSRMTRVSRERVSSLEAYILFYQS